MQKILVLGSTGKVGHVLTRHLAQAGEGVRAATRQPSRFPATPGAEPVYFDYADPATYEAALEGCDRVFLLEPQPFLPAPPYTYMIPFVEVASRKNCKVVMMSSASVAFLSGDPLRSVEEVVQHSRSSYVILRPNWFMDNFHTMWIEPILQANTLPLPAGDARTAFVDSRDVAATAAAVLRTDAFDGGILTLTGPESLSYAEVASHLSHASGRSIHYVPTDDRSFLQSLLEIGLPAEAARYLTELFVATRKGASAEITGHVQRVTDRQPRTFAEYAQDHASIWG